MNLNRKILYPAIGFLLLAGLFFSPASIQAASYSFDFNPACRGAYDMMLELRIRDARNKINDEEDDHPGNLIPVYLENYGDLLELISSEDPSRFDLLEQNESERLAKLDRGPDNNPYKLFCKAEILTHWALLRIKFNDYITAIFEIRKARKLLLENQLKFPGFKPNEKSLATMECALGSIPDNYKWGGSILGLEGNMQAGMDRFAALVKYGNENDFIYHHETVMIYSLLLFHLGNDPQKAWTLLQDEGLPIDGNLMSFYTVSHIGVYGGHCREMIPIFERLPKGTQYQEFPIITYYYGLAKLYRLDTDADKVLLKFLQDNHSQDHIKTVLQKIAWHALIYKDRDLYRSFMNKVKEKGTENIDSDKQAQKEAMSTDVPNIYLIKARLLSDGGFLDRALDILKGKTRDSFGPEREKLEFDYRMARIYDMQNDQNKALIYYQNVIEHGRDQPYYFASNSALHMAYIYEQRKNKPQARQYYKLCLSMKDQAYERSLSQKAKAGLNRLGPE